MHPPGPPCTSLNAVSSAVAFAPYARCIRYGCPLPGQKTEKMVNNCIAGSIVNKWITIIKRKSPKTSSR